MKYSKDTVILFEKLFIISWSSINSENAVKQASRANASEREDHEFFLSDS